MSDFPITHVLLARHGGTMLSDAGRFAGSTNVMLSDVGREQVRRLGVRLASRTIDVVYASPLQRAIDTAMAIASHHGLPVHPEPNLREIDHGQWEGLVHKDVESTAAYEAWSADPMTFAPPGGETGYAILTRAAPALRRIVTANAGRTITIVSHTATNRLLLAHVLGIEPRRYRDRIAQDLACLNELEFTSPTEAKVIRLNDVSHYA